MQIQFKDHAGSGRRLWDTDDGTIASNTNTLDELNSQCLGSGSPTSGELAIRTEQRIQIFKKTSRNHPCSGSKKVFDYDVWFSQQTRVRDEVIKIGLSDFSTIKKLAKSRLQTNYRYIKGPMRPVDYILKMKFFDKKLGKKARNLKDLINLKKLISSPELSFEAQVWRGMTTLCVGKTVIEMSLAKMGDVCQIPIVQIYNDIFMLHQSKRTDPLKQAIVYVQKSKYCQQDIDYFHETIIEPIQKELRDSEMILEVPDAKYSISLRSGCVGHINGYPVSDDLSCIHISSEELDEVYCRLLGTIEGFVSVAQFPKEEIERYFEENGTKLPDSCYHVFFSSQKHCLAARRKHRDMMPYLVCENIIGETPAIEFAMDIKWYVRPFQGRAHLTIRNPHELTFTQEVLKHHNVMAEFFIEDDKLVYDQLDLRWGGALRDTAAHDEKVFAQIVRKALALNQIYYKSFTIEREQARFCTKKNLVRRIHQRLVRAAINSGCWNRTIPIEDEDWDKLFEDSQNLPWHVTIGHEFPFHDHLEGNASVLHWSLIFFHIFMLVVFTDNFEMAEKLMCFLLERSPDKDTFTLNPMDKLGARFFPCYRSFRYIPLNIRAACHDKITELDVKWREQGSSDHLNWLRLRDCGTDREDCRLTVEGWPIDNVHSACEKLSQVCEGVVLDCSIGNREVLFTDFGDAFIYNLNEKYNGAVVFLVDRLNRNITLFGAEQLTSIVEEKLLCFTANWEYFIVETSVVIDRPRYFPQLKDVIEKLSKDIIEQNNGGGVFKNVYDSVYHFKGQIHQFRELVQLLETLQDAVEDVYFENRSVRPICPICFMKVDLFSNYQLSICGDYYCLSCLVRMIKHYIKSRELPIFCCVSTCKAPVAVEDIIFLLMGDMKMPARFVHKKFQPIIQSILDVNLAVNPHLKPCSTPDCIGINILTTVPGSTSICSKCGAIRCGQCCENVHDGFSCEYYKRISGDVQLSISEFKKSKGKSVRDCPNVLCQAVIEKSAGCNHMQCHYCKTNFCWLCEYNSDCQKNVYIHLNEVHGGAGGGWRVENDMIVGFPDDVAEDVLIAAALENALEL